MTDVPELVNDAEPLIVMTDGGTRRCEARTWCGLRSRWSIEATGEATVRTMGEYASGQPPAPPVRLVCDNHVLGALRELLEVCR